MNRSVFQSSLLQQMVGAGSFPSWWSMSNLRPSHGDSSPHLLPLPSSSSPMSSWYESTQELPHSWRQLLLGGLVLNEEERNFLGSPSEAKKMENWEEQMICDSQGVAMGAQAEASWSQILPSSSPRSCITSSFNSNMLDFLNSKSARKHHPPPDLSSECNSTEAGGALKKARVHGSSPSQFSTFKVRKEKLGDRITVLHQLVSPFGKTDTASVLLEAIGYIRFLHGQIEALSSPYLSSGSGYMSQPSPGEQRSCILQECPGQAFNEVPKKDLSSKGLCLVPVSCLLHVGSENWADYWSPSIGSSMK